MLPGADGASGGPARPGAVNFARNQLIAAQRAGILPSNFNVAQTGQNVLGQFHMLNPAIRQSRHSLAPAAQDANRARIQQAIGSLGGNNLFAGARNGMAQWGGGAGGGRAVADTADPTGGGLPAGVDDLVGRFGPGGNMQMPPGFLDMIQQLMGGMQQPQAPMSNYQPSDYSGYGRSY